MQEVIAEKDLLNLRRKLHSEPELSGAEDKTVKTLVNHLGKYNPQKIFENVGGHSLIAVFDSFIQGPSILFRAELDALPITEDNNITYSSKNLGIAHLCGHDGHMTILLGLADLIARNKISKGKVALLFQSAEETGEGAKLALQSKEMAELKPDYIFSFHNVPGFETGSILIKNDLFAYASKAYSVKLTGKPSHAANSGEGINPAFAMSNIILQLNDLSNKSFDYSIAIIFAVLGKKSFGTTASTAEFGFTLRSDSDEKLDIISTEMQDLISKICIEDNLKYEIHISDEFPCVVNNKENNEIIKKAAYKSGIPVIELNEAFRWSEDFAWFTKEYKAAMFGIGAGENHELLHSNNYDFPDEIINSSISVLFEIIKDFNLN